MTKKPKPDTERDGDGTAGEATDKTAAATVTFTGDPRGRADPDVTDYGGKSFPKGKAVSVDAGWLKANPNIRKNNHFKVE